MPRGPLSAEAKAKMSRAAKKRWARLKSAHNPHVPSVPTNGLRLERRLILHVHGQELTLSGEEAHALRAALNTLLLPPPEESTS